MSKESIRLAVQVRRGEGASDEEILKEFIDSFGLPQQQILFKANLLKQEETKAEIFDEDYLKKEISEILNEIGMPAKLNGYHYLRTAIMIAVKEPVLLHKITTVLYPRVAKEHETTASRVERAIRHAIEIAWDRADNDVLQLYFGYAVNPNSGKATNGEFIAIITDRLMLKHNLKSRHKQS